MPCHGCQSAIDLDRPEHFCDTGRALYILLAILTEAGQGATFAHRLILGELSNHVGKRLEPTERTPAEEAEIQADIQAALDLIRQG